jgi:putative transposase
LVSEANQHLDKLKIIWVDSGYSGANFARAISQINAAEVAVLKRENKEFKVMPRRWVGERTFAWIVQNRRLIVDHEQLPEISEAMIYAAMCRLMLRQLASQNKIA